MTSRRDLMQGTVATAVMLISPYDASNTQGPTDSPEPSVRILVPAFAGAGELSVRVANVLRLMVSHDFQEGPGGRFGRAVLIWNDRPLPNPGYQSAIKAALDLGTFADLVLWGEAYELSDGVVTQCYLTVTPLAAIRPRLRPEIWTVAVNSRDGRIFRIARELSELQFDFDPFVLRRELVDEYRSIPALSIYSDRRFTRRVGTIGPGFRALVYEKDAVYLISRGVKGWVPLPKLADAHIEVVEFTSAVIRLMRGDWSGAETLLTQVRAQPNLPAGIMLNTLLLLGIVHEKLGRSGLAFFTSARDSTNLSQAASEFFIMGIIAEIKRQSVNARRLKQTLLSESQRYSKVFGATAWYSEALSAIESVGSS